MKKMLLTALAAASLAFAPIASASPTDDAYLAEMHSHGIADSRGDGALVTTAHQICEILQEGYTETQLISVLGTTAAHLTQAEVTFIVQTSEKYYCPTVGHQHNQTVV